MAGALTRFDVLKIVRSSRFQHDLVKILSHVNERSTQGADRLADSLDSEIELLANFPYLGELQPDFGEHTRRIIVGAYVVYYEVAPDRVFVLRLYHSSQNITSLTD